MINWRAFRSGEIPHLARSVPACCTTDSPAKVRRSFNSLAREALLIWLKINTVDSQEYSSKKGPGGSESNSAGRLLTLPGYNPDRPRRNQNHQSIYPLSTLPYFCTAPPTSTPAVPPSPTATPDLLFQFPATSPVSHSFLYPILPLTSTGLFSPPSNLPLVTLPNHSPISPIPDNIHIPLGSPTSVSEVVREIGKLSPEPEWDNFVNSPTFNDQRNFWDSRRLSEEDLLSPLVEGVRQLDINKVLLVDTICSELEAGPVLVTGVHQNPAIMPVHEGLQAASALAAQREKDVIDLEANDLACRQRLNFKMSDYTEDDLDRDNVSNVEAMLREIREEHIGISVAAQNVIAEYREELGSAKVKLWEDTISDQSRKVKNHAKKIRAKAQQIAPANPLSTYEVEMLAAQKATAEAQTKLVETELRRQQRENKESRAMVSSKVLEFKDKVRALEGHIKLVETREDAEFWEKTGAETITRAMKDLKTWEKSMESVEEVFRDFEKCVKVHGEPDNALDVGHDLASVKDLLSDLKIDFKEAKKAVIKEDKERALFSLETSKGEVLKYPTFAGEAGQDYVKFKEKTEYRFKRNQVAKQDQLEKLRENLK